MVQDLSSIYIIIIITVIKYSSVRPPHRFIHMHHKSILTCASTAPIHTYASYINSCMAFQLTFLYTFHINSMHGISLPVFPHNSYAFHFKHIFISIQLLGNVKYIYIYGKQNCPLTWSSSNNSLAPHIKAS